MGGVGQRAMVEGTRVQTRSADAPSVAASLRRCSKSDGPFHAGQEKHGHALTRTVFVN